MCVATGLSQEPVKNPTFYYRLSDRFIPCYVRRGVRLCFATYERDFLIRFQSDEDRDQAIANQMPFKLMITLFGVLDPRLKELFVTLDYLWRLPTTITAS